MHAQAPIANAQLPPEEQLLPDYDFSRCQRVKKLATHDLYRFTHQNSQLVVKLFAPEHEKSYQKDVDILRRIHNDRVPRVLFSRVATDPLSYDPLERSHLLVMNEAAKGDLNDYLRRIERMGQKMTRTYLRSLLETLQELHSQQPPIVHPNLQPSSILLTNEGRLQVCGWSGQSAKAEHPLEDSIFACGELAMCMLMGHMPFFKKYSSTDPFYKLVTPAGFPKFWSEMGKSMMRYDKKFAFSANFKTLIENVFLRKVASFTDMLKFAWVRQQVYPQEELGALLENQEQTMLEKRKAKRIQKQISQQKRQQLVHKHQLSLGNSRSGQSAEDEEFLRDYQQHVINEGNLPEVKGRPMCLRVSAQPGFIIASLKDFLRQEKGTRSALLRERFILQNHKVVRAQNYVIIELCFKLADLQDKAEQESIEPEAEEEENLLHLKIRLSFGREGKEIYAELQNVESNFNEYYTNLALRLIQERIVERRTQAKGA